MAKETAQELQWLAESLKGEAVPSRDVVVGSLIVLAGIVDELVVTGMR